jgi:hypothetical protein
VRTREIKRNEWQRFFTCFNQKHEGWLVTLEILGKEIGAQVSGRELPFEGVVIKCDVPQTEQISIILGARTDQHITHSIDRPVEVVLAQTDDGDDVSLAIKTSDGVITVLRFREAVLSDRVDDVIAESTKANHIINPGVVVALESINSRELISTKIFYAESN